MKTKANLTIRKDILGKSFSSANIMRDYVPHAVVRLVKAQPGYTAKTRICLSRTERGGIRLFAHTTGDSRTGEWMDASLQDLPISVAGGSKEEKVLTWPYRSIWPLEVKS